MGKANPEITKEVLEVVRTLPGITAREVYTFMPHVPKGTVSSILHSLKIKGTVIEEGTKTLDTASGPRPFAAYMVSDSPVPLGKKRKLKQPTDDGLREQMKELRRQLVELEAWKEAAMSRFPDLAVSPIVLKARKLVADEVRAGGDMLLANQIVEGKKDETLLVKVAIKALEEVDD
jgi:hypothetical protein